MWGQNDPHMWDFPRCSWMQGSPCGALTQPPIRWANTCFHLRWCVPRSFDGNCYFVSLAFSCLTTQLLGLSRKTLILVFKKMRSHPYTPPPPLPPILNDLADELGSILPNRSPRASAEKEVELGEIDPETSRLLQPPPARQHLQHHVRVQGKLALVKSISTADLRSDNTRVPTPPFSAAIPSPRFPPRYEFAVGSVPVVAPNDTNHTDEHNVKSEPEDAREVVARDKQLRGYGIGGAGNIRKLSKSGCGMLLIVDVANHASLQCPGRPTDVIHSPTSSNRKWNLREILGLPTDPNTKGKKKAGL